MPGKDDRNPPPALKGRGGSSVGRGPRGTRLRGSRKGGPQRTRTDGHRWSDEAEAIFLDHLAASCNVAWSAEQAGFTKETVYKHRRRDPAFTEKWQAALEQGYARLEIELVRTATDYLAELRIDPERPLKEMSVKEAISILAMHHKRRDSAGRLGGTFDRPPRSLDEVKESILAKLEGIELERRARLALPKPADGNQGKQGGDDDGGDDDGGNDDGGADGQA